MVLLNILGERILSLFPSSFLRFRKLEAGDTILFQIKDFSRKVKETTLLMYLAKNNSVLYFYAIRSY